MSFAYILAAVESDYVTNLELISTCLVLPRARTTGMLISEPGTTVCYWASQFVQLVLCLPGGFSHGQSETVKEDLQRVLPFPLLSFSQPPPDPPSAADIIFKAGI